MNNVSTKDWIEWLIMGFSFLFSLYVYVNHTRRLNRQQKTINDQQSQINDYIIKENEEQERNKKKACIICEILDPIEKGKARRLRMKNMGLSDARNINIEIIDNEEVFFFYYCQHNIYLYISTVSIISHGRLSSTHNTPEDVTLLSQLSILFICSAVFKTFN